MAHINLCLKHVIHLIVTVEFLTAAPEIQELETVYCDFQANLELTQNNLDLINVENSNGWSLFSTPGSSVCRNTR